MTALPNLPNRPASPRRRKLMQAAAGASTLGATALGGFPAIVRAQPGKLKIGVILPRSGVQGQIGQSCQMGADIAPALIKDLLGVDIELMNADWESNVDVARTRAERLIQEGAHVLVGPFDSGAASAIATSLGLARIPALIPIASFCGAMLATFAVLTLARRRGRLDSNRLILAGLVLNAFFSALILLAVSLAKGSDLALAVRWMMGGFSAASWADVMLLGGSLVAGLAVLASIGGEIRMLEFGEEDARSKGVDPDRINTIAFVTASLMTGIAVSVSGIIGFIGLLVPHAIRSIWRRDYRFLIYLCAFGGAILLAAADAAARVVVAPSELPVGVLTALLGVPFFLVMLRRKES